MRQSSQAIRLKLIAFDDITASRGWDTDAKRCRELGLSPTTMSLLRSGGQNVGGRVIHRIMSRLDVPYLTLFEEIPSRDAEVA